MVGAAKHKVPPPKGVVAGPRLHINTPAVLGKKPEPKMCKSSGPLNDVSPTALMLGVQPNEFTLPVQ
jgi:hypothetical protein